MFANILSKYLIYIFYNFGRYFFGSFPMLFSKAPASWCKKILNSFLLYCTSIFMSAKNMSQIFKILLQTGDINIFVLRGVFFSRYVELKSSFSVEKTSAVKSETQFSREAIENWRGKVLKKNSIIGRSWSSAKLFKVQNYTENAKWVCAFNSRKCMYDIFSYFEFEVRTCSFFIKYLFILWR